VSLKCADERMRDLGSLPHPPPSPDLNLPMKPALPQPPQNAPPPHCGHSRHGP